MISNDTKKQEDASSPIWYGNIPRQIRPYESVDSRLGARMAILSWRDAFPLIETSGEVMIAAADLATDHQLGIWDAVILSAASEAGCRLLLSEDFQEGFTWKGVTVTNPFRTPKHDLLVALFAANPGT